MPGVSGRGVTGALVGPSRNTSDRFIRCFSFFSLLLRRVLGGLPATARLAYEPFQVDLLFSGVVGLWGYNGDEGKEKGRETISGLNANAIGDGGAYISES